MSNSSFSNPNGKIFKINDACPLCWLFLGVIGLLFSIASVVLSDHTNNSLIVIIIIASIASLIYGWLNKDKNTSYIIDSKNNCFYIPLKDEPFCKLSDIDTVNKRQELRKDRESYTENGKTKYRTVTKHTYYVQIIGEEISTDFSFESQGKRDHLYSSLRIGIKDVNDLIKSA
jgi:hypothetical protein